MSTVTFSSTSEPQPPKIHLTTDELQQHTQVKDQGHDTSMTENDNIEDPYIQHAPPDWPLCDSWITNTRGGIMIYNDTFYEVRRVPNTLSDQLMSEDDFGILPSTTAPGLLIIGDKVEELTLVQVRAKKREVGKKGEVVENADGSLVHPQGLEDTRLAIETEEFKSLPIVKVDPSIHHVKLPRSLREVKNLITVRGVPHLIQLVGRAEEGRVVTLRYGQDLTSWNIGPFVDGAKVQLPQEWKYQWVVDIVLALQNLHKLGILHGDLTTNNVLYDHDHAILCDLESGPHTDLLIPPELAQGLIKDFNAKMDIYGLGTLLWSIENRNMPRPHRKLECTGVFADLMSRCMADDPDDRPTLDQIIEELRRLPQTRSLFPNENSITNLTTCGTDTSTIDGTPSGPALIPDPSSWWYTHTGAVVNLKGTFYEIRRVPDTLSDRILNHGGPLPVSDSPGVTINGNSVEHLTSQEVHERRKTYNIDENCHPLPDEDGTFDPRKDVESSQSAIQSDVFKSLPIIEVDPNIHHVKKPRSINELKNLISIQGDSYVVQLLGRTTHGKIVTSKYGDQTLLDWINDIGKKLPQEWKYQWVVDIALGLSNLHQKNIVHNDLADQNILLKDDHAIICDLESEPTTLDILPPEYAQDFCTIKEKSADIYALGVLLWLIENKNSARPHRTLECTGILKEIMSRCLAVNRKERPTIDQVVYELWRLPQTSSLFPEGYEPREAIPPKLNLADVDHGFEVKTDGGDEEKTVYQIDGSQRLPWRNWLYNDKGALISYNGIV
ncbi:serine/threonine protein kinase [Kwoniella mangroviensis CBS 8886]|nr:serine/threonine protein kinase [Kwoniella mangroviensis CBS 8886]